MSNKYIPGEIEPKWQVVWEERGCTKRRKIPTSPSGTR
jgi:hypothetical protein